MSDTTTQSSEYFHPVVRYWLFAIAAMLVLMVLVGGVTRLTDSGLSITEWKPVTGIVPPLSAADWNSEFAKYKTIPEYQKMNQGMSLDDFKSIYWWEWTHRALGRLIGVVFALPLLVFWLKGWINPSYRKKLLFVLLLGAAQGGLGWFMVMSGLSVRVDVSQYRLAAHLGLAAVIFTSVVWLALQWGKSHEVAHGPPTSTRIMAYLLPGLILIQICLGGLVAGLKAGWTYNTWPLMNGAMFPKGLYMHHPVWLSVFEDIMTVQFNHRMMAYLIGIVVLVHLIIAFRRGLMDFSLILLAGGVLAQIMLGIWTLLMAVPLYLGLLHQLAAMIVLGFSLYHLHKIIRQDEHTFHSFSY